MAIALIKPVHMDLILDRIHEGLCIPFLGAAANVKCEKRNYQGLPIGIEVASELVKKIEFMGKDKKNLAEVALQYEFRTDRSFLIKSLKSILPDRKCKASPIVETIAKLPFKLIITTNYDRLMERALEDESRDFKVVVQSLERTDNTSYVKQRLDELAGYDGCIIYKIHGTFNGRTKYDIIQMGKTEETSIIITEDDYIKFLTQIDKHEHQLGVPRQISGKFTYSTLLFLGYSLEDWDFRTIYKGLIEPLPKHQARRSFAIQKNTSNFWIEYWESKGVFIYNIDVYEFADYLMEKYQETYGNSQN